MRSGAAQVAQDLGIVAARFFEGVGQNSEAVRVQMAGWHDSLLVGFLPQTPHDALVTGKYRGRDGNRTEGYRAKDVTEDGCNLFTGSQASLDATGDGPHHYIIKRIGACSRKWVVASEAALAA
jgi:hypothetical protein